MTTVDPSLRPTSVWEKRVMDRAQALGVTLRRVRADGDAVECKGPAGRVVAAELRLISYGDVERCGGIRD
jgi:hypothetical protein